MSIASQSCSCRACFHRSAPHHTSCLTGGKPPKYTAVKSETSEHPKPETKMARNKNKILRKEKKRKKKKFTGLLEEWGIQACPAEELNDGKFRS